VAAADRAIGEILEAIERVRLKDSTTLIIVGDHGFMDMHSVIRPNIWLANDKLWKTGPEWGVKFQAAGGSAFLYLQHPGDVEKVNKARELLTQLPDSIKSRFRIVEKRELIVMGADKNAILALAAIPGVVFSNGTEGAVTGEVKGGHHGYDPDLPEMHTGFIAAGAHIQAGKVIPSMTVVDIAPIVMSLLHVEFHSVSGKVPQGLVER